MGKDQRRLVNLRDDVCHRKGFARTGNTQQGLFPVAGAQTFNKAGDSSRLVTGRLVRRVQFKIHPKLPPEKLDNNSQKRPEQLNVPPVSTIDYTISDNKSTAGFQTFIPVFLQRIQFCPNFILSN